MSTFSDRFKTVEKVTLAPTALAEKTVTLDPELAGLVDYPAGTLNVKDWTFKDWTIVATDGTPLAKLTQVSASLVHTPLQTPPYFDLRVRVNYAKQSLGYSCTGIPDSRMLNVMTFELLHDGVPLWQGILDFQISNGYSSELRIACDQNPGLNSFREKLDVDYYEDTNGAQLSLSGGPWNACPKAPVRR